MNLFRVRGILLSVHVSFFLLLAVNAFYGWSQLGWAGVLWNTALLIAFFTCVVLHELGHSFTAMHFGIGVRRILLMPIGGMAEFESIPRDSKRELLITFAGPAVNFVIAAVLWLALPRDTSPDDMPVTVAALTPLNLGYVLIWWNLAMGCFNFLPAFPMDGGRILRAALATRVSHLRATYLAATVGKIFCALGCVVALYINQPLLLVLFAFIFFVGEMEYRATRQREIEEAHLRATLAQMYPIDPTTEVPPLLTR
jgi:Zn-dependent protease